MGMGDQIILLPYIHAISKKFKSPVSLLTKKNARAEELFFEDHHINEVISLSEDLDGISGILRLSKILKKKNFDRIFIFNSSLRYNLIARFSGIKFINQYPLFLKKNNIVYTAKLFTESITGNIINTEPNLIIKKKDNDLDKSYKYICLGISSSGPTKRWDIENYIKLADKINQKIKCKFFLAGGPKDIELISKFKKTEVGKKTISFEKMNIKQTLQYISSCDLYIGNDTGWAHISVALNVKAVTIFCDSPVKAYGSYSSKMFTIEPEGIEKGTTTHDTLGKDKISFNEVLGKSIKLLD
tara:strand:- start:259 stop:1155 length:897 start_codon:yes stop_codon:yes gene_type:complete